LYAKEGDDMARNVKLKSLMFEKGISNKQLAEMPNIHATLILMVLHGRYRLNAKQEERISKIIGKPREVLFPQD
jgi:ribosome-binding protein aMBF1 (putative translation factor)